MKSKRHRPVKHHAFNRRHFLKSTSAALGLTLLGLEAEMAGAPSRPRESLIDVNVNLARWPLRSLPLDNTAALAAKLHKQGVMQAWAGSFEGLLAKDIAAVNLRLAAECRRHGRGVLLPFGSINPRLPDWKEELRRCVELHQMPGIRLHPNYHGYKLDDPGFAELLSRATDEGLIVQVALTMEDERMMHPLLRVETVDVAPLAKIVGQMPGLRLVLLNALSKLRGRPLFELLESGVYVEIAMLEGIGGIASLLDQVPINRVLFGSHAPLFYFESSLLKLNESPLNTEQLYAIRQQNAQQLLAKRR